MWKTFVSRALGTGILIGAVATASAANVVEPGSFDHIVTLESRMQSPGTMEGTIRNRGEREIRDVVIQVRHNWVWPFAGRDRPDTAMRTETIRIEGPLNPGDSAGFRSQQHPPGDLPADAGYLGNARVIELTEMHRVARE